MRQLSVEDTSMAKGKGSSRGHGQNPKGSHKPKGGNRPRPTGGNRPNRPQRPSGSKIDIGEISKVVEIIVGQLSGNKPGSAELKQPGGAEPKAAEIDQADLQTFIDLIEKELAKEKPDKEFIAVLLKKIKDGAAPGGATGNLTATLDDLIKKLRGLK
jgi:hypothetical protein